MQPYKKLFTYWFALIIYDLTVEFCERWVRSWKLKEQMNGAARSGKQNIVEGSEGMATSLKTGIKLTNVAKASIEELLGNLEDFLRQRKLSQWSKDDPRVRVFRARSARIVRNLSILRDLREPKAQALLARLKLPKDPEEATNLLLTLCHQATYLLYRQVKSLEKKHETEGGYAENLYHRRLRARRVS
ncbi:four helix bundle suffix domain-containing protein [Patescibacteria group bacterium]|nr:four helix bundle suffix domain-containing protein [Patescibacteria group bacterium]